MTREIGIVGYGRFGRLAASFLSRNHKVFIADRRPIRVKASSVRTVSLQEAAGKETVILAVPINKLPIVLKRIAPFLTEQALVCDVSSVKEEPARWMKLYLPTHVSILGTHPLFGPDSVSDSLNGRNIVLSPIRISRQKIETLTGKLNAFGLNVFRMSPRAHDKLMASTLLLTQFIGRGLVKYKLPATPLTTHNFDLLRQIVSTANNDTVELFKDMFQFNRFAKAQIMRVPGIYASLLRSLER
jgi:prephenate dehydrogenase